MALTALCLACCSDDGGAPAEGRDAGVDDVEVADAGLDPDAPDAPDAVDAPDAPDAVDALDLGDDLDQAADDDSRLFVDEDFTIVDEPEDVGTACDSHEACEAPYVCAEGVCTLELSTASFVEQTYTVREPEELAHIFDFVKSFAVDVAFLALEVSDEGVTSRRPARYGAADRVVIPGEPLRYEWQFPRRDRVMLTPVRGPSELWGHAWESNIFQWNLEAHVVLDEFRVDTTFGFVAEQTQIYLEFSDDIQVATGEFRGVVTRQEAEERVFGDTEFEPFRPLLCLEHPDLLPLGEDWSLADLLDCNAAPLDVDSNGDGVLDGYRTIFDIRVEPATIVEPADD